MNKKILALVLTLVLAILTASFAETVLAKPIKKKVEVKKEISVDKAYSMIFSENHHDLVIIDLRPTEMYEAGHISGAINVPFVQLPPPPNFAVLNAWIASPEGQSHLNDKIIVHCIGGIGSPVAVGILSDAGFKKVYNMEGGFNAWIAAGYPIVT